MKESSGLEKKIKISKASGLEKEDNDLLSLLNHLSSGMTTELEVPPDAPGRLRQPGTPPPLFIRPTKSSRMVSAKPPLKYEPSLIPYALSLVVRPTVTPPCLNKGNLSPLRSSSFLHCLVSNYTLQ